MYIFMHDVKMRRNHKLEISTYFLQAIADIIYIYIYMPFQRQF